MLQKALYFCNGKACGGTNNVMMSPLEQCSNAVISYNCHMSNPSSTPHVPFASAPNREGRRKEGSQKMQDYNKQADATVPVSFFFVV